MAVHEEAPTTRHSTDGGIGTTATAQHQHEATIRQDVEGAGGARKGREQSLKILFQYEEEVSLDHRKEESQRIRERYPSRVPLVCERVPESVQKSVLPTLTKKKFLIPGAMTLAQFTVILKSQIKEEKSQAANRTLYFMLRNRRAPALRKTLAELHSEFSDEDGFLYLHYCEETVFGENQHQEQSGGSDRKRDFLKLSI